jgi:putative addiction module killer protein
VGGGVFEMIVHYGPGYRLYYCRRGKELYQLPCGGTKAEQRSDIERAKAIKRYLDEAGDGDA